MSRVHQLLVVLLLTLGGLVMLRYVEDAMIFPAPKVPISWLHQRALAEGADEITLTTEDGTRLYGWHMRARGEGVVLWFDGNGTTVGQRPREFRRFVVAGWDVVHVNYRGYPGSEGSPSEAGLREDARAVWDYAASVAPRRVVYGKSLGGGVAVGLAAERPAAALVVESTFTRISDLARGIFFGVPVDTLMRNRFDSLALVPRVTCPTLVLHGDDDMLIPVSHARTLAARFGGPTRVETFAGAGHNNALLMEPEGWEALVATFGSPGPTETR